MDKEQIKDSLKNHSQNFSENSTQEKEQIMIDGVNVNKCIDFNKRDKVSCYHILYDKCDESPNCYFKQLARKTAECELLETQLESYHIGEAKLVQRNQELEQECEKLKNQVNEDYNYYTTELKILRDIISNKEKRNAALFITSGHYRKALEEIESICLEDVHTFADGTELRYDSLDDILDIINNAKGEEDKQ